MMRLQVEAYLRGAIAMPGGPIALDGLLAAAVAMRDGITPALTEADLVSIEIPVQREPAGRFHLASFSHSEVEEYEGKFLNRRFPITEAQSLGEQRLKRVGDTAGPCKSYHIPFEIQHLRDAKMTWWCIGEPEEIFNLLTRHISHLGKKRAAGLGAVREWRVQVCEPGKEWGDGFPCVLRGRPTRPLPLDWPDVLPDSPQGLRVLTYPYWQQAREEMVWLPMEEDRG